MFWFNVGLFTLMKIDSLTNLLQGQHYNKTSPHETKDQDPKEKKSGVIYNFQCNHIPCNEEYIGEIARTLGERCQGTPKTNPLPSTHTYNKQDTTPQKTVSTS